MLTHVDIAARKALDKKRTVNFVDARLNARKRVLMQRELESARREGTEIETAAKMILRICDGKKA